MWLKALIILIIQGVQLYLVFCGVERFGEFVNPVLLLVVTFMLVAMYYLVLLRSGPQVFKETGRKDEWVGLILGALAIAAMFPGYQQLFRSIPNPVNISDVLPQLEGQYDRFVRGGDALQADDIA